MTNHVYRPLYLIIAVIAIILLARFAIVPKDFGIYERGFMYGFHRKSNEKEWEAFKVKFRTRKYCKDCHPDKYESIMKSKHHIIQCENCHGPAFDHPENPPKLEINRERKLCLRCHTKLPYPTSQRGKLKGINPEAHNPEMECVMCHNPHKPDMEGW
ncbi:MAG: cytochrome C [Nitrospirae bacterium]|nr:MAG: cytochrome C [Nitrospirota bacterium]